MRAAAVCEQALDITANDLDLGSYMVFGRGERQSGGNKRASSRRYAISHGYNIYSP